MSARNLLKLSSHTHTRPIILTPRVWTFALRSTTSQPALPDEKPPSTPSPPPPNAMIYDRLAQSINAKIKRLENPDPNFLRYASPHPKTTDYTPVLTFPETKVTVLPNGLRVATETNLASKTATVAVRIDAGSRYEPEDAAGVAHLLERMVFRKTEKSLGEEIEKMGGRFNGRTSREQSEYYMNVMAKDVKKAVNVLADALQNSFFDEKDIQVEKEALIRNILEVENKGHEVVFDHLHATAYQHSPLGRTVLGTIEDIEKITNAQVQDYFSSNYAAHRMVISAAGAVTHEDIVEQVKLNFVKLSANPYTSSQLIAANPGRFIGSEVRMIDDYLPIAQFAVAFEGASWTDPDSITLMVMQTMLGSWSKKQGGGKNMGSELVQRVAINEIADSISAFNLQYKDTGLFGVYAEAKPDCLDDLAYAIMYELSKLCYRVSEADVTRACNQLKSSLLLRIKGDCAIAEDIGHQLITYGRRVPFAEFFARIDSVDVSAVKRVANRFISDLDVAISARGPIQGLPDYNWFRRRTYWLRY